jgi:DNA invertase Pin-like site-specific DNA recombinase
MLGAFAQFERELIKQRQLGGIAKAKERGAYKDVGRKGLPQSTIDSIKSMAASGSKKTDIAKEIGLSRAVIYKYL